MSMNPVLESYLGDGFPNVVLGCRMATGTDGSTIGITMLKKLTTIVTIGYVAVSTNNGNPKSSILIGFSIIFTIHFGVPLFLETPMSHNLGFQKYQFRDV